MLIRNFGLLWERKYIQWGKPGPGHPGHLKGYKNQNRIIDFREQMGIYVLYDQNLAPVYVGQAGRGKQTLFNRLVHHDTDNLWNRWQHFSWFGLRRVNKGGGLSEFDGPQRKFKIDGQTLLNQLEGVLISTIEPKLNRQGGRWAKVDEYFQERDKELDEPTLAELDKRISELGTRLTKLVKGK